MDVRIASLHKCLLIHSIETRHTITISTLGWVSKQHNVRSILFHISTELHTDFYSYTGVLGTHQLCHTTSAASKWATLPAEREHFMLTADVP